MGQIVDGIAVYMTHEGRRHLRDKGIPLVTAVLTVDLRETWLMVSEGVLEFQSFKLASWNYQVGKLGILPSDDREVTGLATDLTEKCIQPKALNRYAVHLHQVHKLVISPWAGLQMTNGPLKLSIRSIHPHDICILLLRTVGVGFRVESNSKSNNAVKTVVPTVGFDESLLNLIHRGLGEARSIEGL